jgi:flagellar hook-associated protein 2
MSSVNALNSFFTSLISDLMLIERQPLVRLQTQRDQLNTRSSVYTEVESKLSELQTAVKALISSSYSNELLAGRSATVSDVTNEAAVLSASVSSSAMLGDYDIQVSSLAQAHRVRSDRQTYADQALGLSGDILLGGAAARSVDSRPSNTHTNESITAFGTASLSAGQAELGSAAYYVETRSDAVSGWQFRLVDANGQAYSIRQGSGETFGSGWQAIPTDGNAYDTGRGLTITFAQAGYQAYDRQTSGVAKAAYTAQGASITVSSSDSLLDIAEAINAADYADGNAVQATVVDRQLVLSAAETGSAHIITASGAVLTSLGILGSDRGQGDTGPADGFKYTLQVAADAVFTVNDIQVTRSRNSGLTDVISGVTLNLAADAEGESARLTISEDMTGARSAIDDFVSQFNDVISYLDEKTAITEVSSGSTKTYTRAALADDNIFGELRMQLFSLVMDDYSVSGSFSSLREIGLSINDDLKVELSDSSALAAALSANLDDVAALMDQVMGAMNSTLGRFTGDSQEDGYLDGTLELISSQLKDVNQEISDVTERLGERQEYFVEQFGAMQAQLLAMSYTQQMWAGIYSTTSQLY